MAKEFDASQYTKEELLELMEAIKDLLGINKIDLRAALLEHYQRCQRIAIQAEEHFFDNPSAMASALNATSAALKEVSRQDIEVYNAEQAKKLELAIINTFKAFPDQKEDLLKSFQQNLGLSDNGQQS